MIKIIADNKIPFLRGAFEGIADIHYFHGKEIDSHIVKDADALIIRTRTKCDEKLLKGSAVKFIATATIGFDHIDTEYCHRNNILWTNAPGCNSSAVEQYIVSALLELSVNHDYNIEGKTIGIIGAGHVGSKVARVAELLGMKVLLNDPPREKKEGKKNFVSLDEVQKNADIITFHVPLQIDGEYMTYHIGDEDFFNMLQKKAVIINSSRGEVVDQDALRVALKTGVVSKAILDVWENEPNPDLDLLERVTIATQHIAGYSTDGKVNGTTMSVKAVSDFFKLAMGDWKPADIPEAENRNIVVDCTAKKKYDILHEVYQNCYDIMEDDSLLRKDAGSFEKLRESYRVRREAGFFNVKLNNNPFEELAEILEGLGFSVLELDCFC